MDPNFWHGRWENGEIGFHREDANPHLVKHIHDLGKDVDSRIFVPFCGKSVDIGWLFVQGYKVVGVELSEIAIKDFFEYLGREPEVDEVEANTDEGPASFKRYRYKNIEIYAGDLFNMTAEILGPVDAIYDRAALIALPDKMRKSYTKHLREITQKAPQLLVALEYDQTLMDGPPFSVSQLEVYQHYARHYDIQPLATLELPNELKGEIDAKEVVWLLNHQESESA